MTPAQSALLADLAPTLGPKGIVTDPADIAPWTIDWRQRFRGTAPALNDLIGSHVDIFFNELATSVELHRAGKARILAVTSEKRLEELPDVPTMIESGMKGYEITTWTGMLAPRNTPAGVVQYYRVRAVELSGRSRYSIVAVIRKGSGKGQERPSTLTCCSFMASSNADCVLGVARLISSASRK